MAVSEYTHTIPDSKKLYPIVFVVIKKFSLVETGIWLLSCLSIYMGYCANVRLRWPDVGQIRFFACLLAESKSSITVNLTEKARSIKVFLWHKTTKNYLCSCLFSRTKKEASYKGKSIVRAPLTWLGECRDTIVWFKCVYLFEK